MFKGDKSKYGTYETPHAHTYRRRQHRERQVWKRKRNVHGFRQCIFVSKACVSLALFLVSTDILRSPCICMELGPNNVTVCAHRSTFLCIKYLYVCVFVCALNACGWRCVSSQLRCFAYVCLAACIRTCCSFSVSLFLFLFLVLLLTILQTFRSDACLRMLFFFSSSLVYVASQRYSDRSFFLSTLYHPLRQSAYIWTICLCIWLCIRLVVYITIENSQHKAHSTHSLRLYCFRVRFSWNIPVCNDCVCFMIDVWDVWSVHVFVCWLLSVSYGARIGLCDQTCMCACLSSHVDVGWNVSFHLLLWQHSIRRYYYYTIICVWVESRSGGRSLTTCQKKQEQKNCY